MQVQPTVVDNGQLLLGEDANFSCELHYVDIIFCFSWNHYRFVELHFLGVDVAKELSDAGQPSALEVRQWCFSVFEDRGFMAGLPLRPLNGNP